MIAPARIAAFDVLRRVEQGGFASDLLIERSAGLTERDAALANQLVLGSLRVAAQLDYLIDQYAGRRLKLDPEVRIALRLGIYQLRYLERIPPHAAVGESVELVRRARKQSASGLVNAVLRKINRDPVKWPDDATELSIPAWMLARWTQSFGPDIARGVAGAALEEPEIYVRHPGAPPEAAGVKFEPTELPGCYRIVEGSPRGFRIQDIGSQSVVPELDLKPGQLFLDLCAAPGNKTAQALESGIRGVACDLQWRRLVNAPAIGCPAVVLDAAEPLPFRERFDRILLDAPCSGTGTLARNPEIKWRLRPEDIEQLRGRQVKLLSNALEYLRPGGLLVYSTCSLETEENETVVEQVLGRLPKRVVRRFPGREPGDGFFCAVIPSK